MNSRLLDPLLIPTSLWDPNEQVLVLPPALASAYCAIIERRGLSGLVAARDRENPPVGGLTQERADRHFAQAFDGSAARTQLALLDPFGMLPDVPDALVRILAGNCICFVDAPCGAGAAAFALLTSIAELRAGTILPRLPLDVHLIAADLSEPSRIYGSEVFREVSAFLEEQGVFVTFELQEWDVTKLLSTTALIRRMTLASPDKTPRLLVVANFNGFLEQEGKRKQADPQLTELFRHASGDRSTAIWIEPAMNSAVGSGGLFSWIRRQLKGAWRLFAREASPPAGLSPCATLRARFRDPLDRNAAPRVGLAVMRVELEHMP